ncbi:MAG: hypothetical protein JWP01_2112 [Myxococcales bacterium]|nr:hypothetical protein [Myxococcales bacterium]
MSALAALIARLRSKRWANLCVINLRFLIGFAFIPSALKKVLDQPFTDPTNSGPFHDFLHAFHATGWFYQFVGVMQLLVAVLLFSQRFATLGALLALPILTAITAFCWSTRVIPTATVATLMLLGTCALAIWDVHRWRAVLGAEPPAAPVELRLWQWCGAAIFVLYLGLCLVHGGVYRPRGMRAADPGLYVMVAIAVLPLITLWIDRARRRRVT